MASVPVFRNILIVADIEGSSGCWRYKASAFMTREWVRACEAMTADVAAVVRAFLDAGVQTVTVKDFHRTGYNLLVERLPRAIRVLSGYRTGPVPGIGVPPPAEVVMFMGLHAADSDLLFDPVD